MFFLNEKVEYLIFDFDNLVDPYHCIQPFLKGPYYIHVITKHNPETLQFWLAHNHLPQKWFTIDGTPMESAEGLEYWMSRRSWSFHDVFITGDNERVLIANERAIGTILVKDVPTFEDVRTGADLVIPRGDLTNVAKYNFLSGYAGEFFMEGAPKLLPGAAPGNGGGSKFTSFVPNFGEYESAYSLGRFFNSSDSCLNSHLYSRFIKSFKDDPNRYIAKTNLILKRAIDFIVAQEQLSEYFISYVPKKPSDTFDRNLVALQNLKQAHNLNYADFLKCPLDYPSQKNAGSFARRRENVRGKYTCDYPNFKGQTIILFDDIYTSGATLAECASALKRQGAGKVISLSLAVVCEPTYAPLLSLNCTCGGPLKIYFKKTNAVPFWNCYKESSCRSNYMDYPTGVLRLRALRAAGEHPDGF